LLQRASDIVGAQFSLPLHVAEELPARTVAHSEPTGRLRQRIVELLSPTPVEVDDIMRESRASPEEVQGILLELEIAGEVMIATRNGNARLHQPARFVKVLAPPRSAFPSGSQKNGVRFRAANPGSS